MYTVTNDCLHFIRLNDKEQAKRLADSIKGAVYITSSTDNLLIYSYKDVS
jgi:hypothetical protein